MDVLVLIDKLDDLVHNAKAVPLTDQVRIDREEIYEILDQMRATIPEEIKQARWIVKERQEMLAEAKRECDRLLGEAREQATREASQTEIVKLAERQAQDILEDARRQARETRLEMEDWADSILSTLEVNLDKFLGAVKRGRERLHERSQETVVAGVGAPAPTTKSRLTKASRAGATLARHDQLQLALAAAEAGRGARETSRSRARADLGSAASATCPSPRRCRASSSSARATTGTVFELRFQTRLHGPCYRCLADAVVDVADRGARIPGDEPGRRTSCGRRTSRTTSSTSRPGRATRSCSRCRTRSSAAPTAQGSVRSAAAT